MNPVRRISAATVLAGALLFAGHDSSQAQVVPEPAMLTARVPITETFQAYVAFPDNSFVMGGMIRFPITRDADLGGLGYPCTPCIWRPHSQYKAWSQGGWR